MKRIALILFIAVLSVSCNDSGRDFREDTRMQKKIVDIIIKPEHWKRQVDDKNNFMAFICEIDMPELRQPIFSEGLYNTYYVWRDKNVTVQQPLPHIIFHENDLGERWTETISCDYSPGLIQFQLRYSDFVDEWPEYIMNFRFIVLM